MTREAESPARELWQVIQVGVGPIVEGLQKQGLDTARRIKGQIDGRLPYLTPYLEIGFYEYEQEEVFVTDRPDKFFGENEIIYTITSSLALENIRDGNLLTPPAWHNRLDQNIQTHRGIGLVLFSRLMNAFGFNLGAKDLFLWLGPKIDGEQFVLEDNIARSGKKVDNQIALQLFNHKNFRDGRIEINPKLIKLLKAINNGWSLYGIEQDITDYVDGLLDVLHRYTGVREGWFNLLEGLLKGTIPPKKQIDPSYIDLSLTFAAQKLAQPSPRVSQAVIIAVYTQELASKTPIYPLPLTPRPPETITPAPHLPVGAVKAVYVEDMPESLRHLEGLIRGIEELPRDKWLTDAHGNIVTPDIARKNGVNPRSPVCVRRYNGNPISAWAKHLTDGDMAPLNTIPYVNLTSPKSYFDHVLRTVVLNKARNSGLVEKVTQMTGDKDIAETRILAEASKLVLSPEFPTFSSIMSST